MESSDDDWLRIEEERCGMRVHADQRTTRRDENLALNLAVCAEHVMMMDTHADEERGKEKGVGGDENGEGFNEGEEEATASQQGAARNRAIQEESGVGLQADRDALLNIQRNPEVHVRASKTYHLPCPVGVDIGGSLAKMVPFRLIFVLNDYSPPQRCILLISDSRPERS
jgi:hypothetical protein